MLDGVRVPSWSACDGRTGQRLVFRDAARGARAILAISGGIAVPFVLGSQSTDVRGQFGGFCGRALRDGDSIPLEPARFFPAAPLRVKPPDWQFDADPIGVVRTPEYAAFDARSRTSFWNNPWLVSPESDRMGLRLHGDALRYEGETHVHSHAVFPGVIQVPPSGQPIVLLGDAPTTGGYPKIGIVRNADRWKLAQAQVGSLVRFVESTLSEAEESLDNLERYVTRVKSGIESRRTYD